MEQERDRSFWDERDEEQEYPNDIINIVFPRRRLDDEVEDKSIDDEGESLDDEGEDEAMDDEPEEGEEDYATDKEDEEKGKWTAAKEDFRPLTKPSEMAKPKSRKMPHEGYEKRSK